MRRIFSISSDNVSYKIYYINNATILSETIFSYLQLHGECSWASCYIDIQLYIVSKKPFEDFLERLDDIFSKPVFENPRYLKRSKHSKPKSKKVTGSSIFDFLPYFYDENSDYFVHEFYIFQPRNSKL